MYFNIKYTEKDNWWFVLLEGKKVAKFKKDNLLAWNLVMFPNENGESVEPLAKEIIDYFNGVGLYTSNGRNLYTVGRSRKKKKKEKKEDFQLYGGGQHYRVFFHDNKVAEVYLKKGEYGTIVDLFSKYIDTEMHAPMVDCVCKYFGVDHLYPHPID